MKLNLFVVFLLSMLALSQSQAETLSPLDRKFNIYSDVQNTYQSDQSIIIYLRLENFPDSIYQKFLDSLNWNISGLPTGASFNKFRKTIKWDKFSIYTGKFTLKISLESPYFADTLS